MVMSDTEYEIYHAYYGYLVKGVVHENDMVCLAAWNPTCVYMYMIH